MTIDNTHKTYPNRKDELVTIDEAHRALAKFVYEFWKRDGEDDQGLLRLLSFNGDESRRDGPPDPAQWSDWLDAIDAVRAEKHNKLQ